jgi:hypothetical protein
VTEDQASAQASAGRTHRWRLILLRAAAFGGGFAIIAALLLGGAIWWLNRPKQWSDRAITTKPTGLMMQQAGDELQLEFRYAFTNHTNAEYVLPAGRLHFISRPRRRPVAILERSLDEMRTAGHFG